MSMRGVMDVVGAQLEGRARTTEWVKNVNQTTAAGVWYDLTGSSGNPRAKQWFDATPLAAQQVNQSTDGGIFHGSAVTGDGFVKYLRSLRLQCVTATSLPLNVLLCDYLLYYPSVEDGNTDPQVMDNTLPLPRYATGAGVQMMAVTISSRTGGQSFVVTYTNQDGTTGRTSGTVLQNTAAAPGSVTTSAQAANAGGNPFIPLQDTDTGVRAIESVQMLGADTGFFALVLVRPLASSVLRSIDAVYEKDFLLMGNELPEVKDDAYLSLLALPNGSMSGSALRGNLQTIWN
jgi:hypothetical protein